MAAALLNLFFFAGVALAIAAAAVGLTCALFPNRDRHYLSQWLLPWTVRGLAAPCLLWALMNIGISWVIPPYMPQVAAPQFAGLKWIPPYLVVLGAGWFVISSFWAAMTLAWALLDYVCELTDPEARKMFRNLCLVAGLVMALIAAGILALGGWLSIGLATFVMLAPVAAYAPGMLYKKPMPPMYARAVAKLKFGKYTEAELEIIKQLEKCEDDFEGWMMLATLYAEHFNDIAEAEQTVLDICDHPKTTPSQLSVALHRLADWYLKMRSDPDGARRALQVVCDRLPGTHLARMAQLRMNQIPTTAKDVQEQRVPLAIPLPALGDSFDDAEASPPMERAAAVRVAHDCVQRLQQDPNNIQVRERFARLLAEHLGDPDKGIEQLKLLLEMPDQPRTRRAEWLSLIAAFHLKHRDDSAAGRAMLEQIVRDYSDTPQAFAARRRLQLLRQPSRS